MAFKRFISLLLLAACVAAVLCACSAEKQTAQQETSALTTTAPATQKREEITLPPDGAQNYTVTGLDCSNGGKDIYAELYFPKNGYKNKTVVLSHSYMLNCKSMQPYCAVLANSGYAAVCFDFCGGSMSSKSDGSFMNMTVFTEVEDLECVVESVRQNELTSGSDIVLLGTSQGGLVSALAAEELKSSVSALILMYPAFNIPQTVKEFSESSSGSVFSSFGFSTDSFAGEYISSLDGYDPYEHIGSFAGPVLILHGTADTVVPIEYSQRAAELYKNARLEKISGASHGFNSENYSLVDYDKTVDKHILEFLASLG